MDFIINECNEATEYLDWIAMDRGRVDKSFAYGLINRMALLGGSLDFGGKSTEYFKIAAEAASKVIGKRLLALNYEDLFVVEGREDHQTGDASRSNPHCDQICLAESPVGLNA